MSQGKENDLFRELASDDGLHEEKSNNSSIALEASDLDRALKAKQIEQQTEAIKDQQQDR